MVIEAKLTALEQLDVCTGRLRAVRPAAAGAVLRVSRQGFAAAANAAVVLAGQSGAAGPLASYTRAVQVAASRYLAPRTSPTTLYIVPGGYLPDGRRRVEPRAGLCRADAVRLAIRALAVELDVVLCGSARVVPDAAHRAACLPAAQLAHDLALFWHAARPETQHSTGESPC